MRPSKYQNNNTESLMGVQTSYMLLDWTNFFFNFQENCRHLFLQCFKFGKAMYIIRNKIRVICSKIRVGMEGGPFSIGGSIFHRGIWTPGSICPSRIWTPGPYSGGGVHIQYDTGIASSLFLEVLHFQIPLYLKYLCVYFPRSHARSGWGDHSDSWWTVL